MQTKADKTVLALHEQNDAAWARQRAGILRYAVMRGWNVECVRCDPNAADVADAIRRTAPVGIISALSCRLDGAVFGTLPVSFFDCPACAVTRGAPYLRHDAEFTAHIVARELFSMKCASYAFVAALSPATGEIATWSRAREHFFAREVLRRGGKWCAPFHPGSAASVDAQLKALAEYLVALPKPCGVFAANDSAAALVRRAALDAGLRLPKDIALVGVDNDSRLCLKTSPTITSVAPDWEGGGYAAAAALGDLLDGRKTERAHTTFRPLGLMRRETTAHAQLREDSRVLAAVALIRAKACKGIGVEQVVATIRSSRRFAEKLFREVTGSSILEEIRRVRFDAAKVLLAHSACPLSQVASRIGYSSVPTFCREFKNLTGHTPDTWRKVNAECRMSPVGAART